MVSRLVMIEAITDRITPVRAIIAVRIGALNISPYLRVRVGESES